MKKRYIHESDLWSKSEISPQITPLWAWDNNKIIELLGRVRHKQGVLLGSMQGLGFEFRAEASLTALTADIVKSGAIEGEALPDEEVRSSIARQLGMNIGGLVPSSRTVDGFVQVVLDATAQDGKPLTKECLFSWHKLLFKELLDENNDYRFHNISIGEWRKDLLGKMQVVSGRIGKEKIHYEAPSANLGTEHHSQNIENEMQRFLAWLETEQSLDPVLKSAIAHLWFVTIHPFDDGNGRLARVISDMLLAQSEHLDLSDKQTGFRVGERFYSMSSAIERNRTSYYNVLQKTQTLDACTEQELNALASLDITNWLIWFLECLEDAITHAHTLLKHTLYKAKVWNETNKHPLNQRQQLVLNKLLNNFEGKLTSTKYAKLAKCSQDTAQRDINALIKYQILKKSEAGGRSTSYEMEIGR